MPSSIYNILFEKNFDDILSSHRLTTNTVVVTDAERRGAFVNEINIRFDFAELSEQLILPAFLSQYFIYI